MRRPYGFATNLIGIKIGMVLSERRKKRDFDVLQDPRGAIVPVVPFLSPHSANYPEQCKVIKRNAFPDKLQISRAESWRIILLKNSQQSECWIRRSRNNSKERWFKLDEKENIFDDKENRLIITSSLKYSAYTSTCYEKFNRIYLIISSNTACRKKFQHA